MRGYFFTDEIGYILCANTACAYNNIIANMNSGENNSVTSYPHIVSESNLYAVFITKRARIGVQGVPCRVY